MSKKIFVTATNTDIGKTYTTIRLLKELASQGLKVGVIKPVETGVVDDQYLDGDVLLSLIQELNPEFKDVKVQDIVPIKHQLPAAPFIASGGEMFDFKKVDASVKKLEALCDILVFEGAGGLLVPLDAKHTILDIIKLYQATTLLVTHCSLGCINDTLLSKNVLDDAKIKNIVAFNCRSNDEKFVQISAPYFDAVKFDVLKVDEDIDKICDVLYNL